MKYIERALLAYCPGRHLNQTIEIKHFVVQSPLRYQVAAEDQSLSPIPN